jgi:hypothetical protein
VLAVWYIIEGHSILLDPREQNTFQVHKRCSLKFDEVYDYLDSVNIVLIN